MRRKHPAAQRRTDRAAHEEQGHVQAIQAAAHFGRQREDGALARHQVGRDAHVEDDGRQHQHAQVHQPAAAPAAAGKRQRAQQSAPRGWSSGSCPGRHGGRRSARRAPVTPTSAKMATPVWLMLEVRPVSSSETQVQNRLKAPNMQAW
jgi:hypothetical protein